MRILSNKNQTKTGIDKDGFAQLFDAYYDELQHFIYFKSGDTEIAEDIVQDTFMKIWEIRSTVRIDTARALLYTIASNRFANKYKRQKLKFQLQQSITEERTYETPEYEMEVKEFDQKLQKVLSELSVNNRTTFLMNRIDQMTYNEIAINLNISVKAVEKRMNKALEFIRAEIKHKF